MLEFKISEKIADDKWDKHLLNSDYATFYQSSKFLEVDESRFPIFIYIVDEKNNVKEVDDLSEAVDFLKKDLEKHGAMTGKQKLVAAIMGLVVFLWI